MDSVSNSQPPLKQPNMGVVVVGLGLRAIAVVPLFDFLERENIDIDLLIGSSDASRICAQWGLGLPTQQIIENEKRLLKLRPYSKMDYRTIFNMVHPKLGRFNEESGAVRRKPILDFNKQLFGNARLEDLKPTTILKATDLELRSDISLEKGPLAECVYASSAFFPFVPPIKMDGKILADGGLSNPLPLVEAVKRGLDIILAIVVIEDKHIPPSRFSHGLANCFNIIGRSIIQSQLALAINLHHFEIIPIYVKCKHFISPENEAQIGQLLHWGEEAVKDKGAEIKMAIQQYYDH